MTVYVFNGVKFDASRGELVRDDETLAVRHKVSELIHFLIRNRDRVVRKEELLSSLWEQGDFRESSLTQSIREARRLLQDSAQQPSFIRTYPQKGYQWIAETDEVTALEPPVEEAPEAEPEAARRGSRFRQIQIAASVLLICLLAWGGFNYFSPGNSVVKSGQFSSEAPLSLLILPFIDESGLSQMDWMEMGLSDMVASRLQRDNQLRITPPAAVHQLLAVNEMPWPMDVDNVQQLLQNQRADAALMGTIRQYNGQQVLDIQLRFLNGDVKEGSLSFPQLADALPLITEQLQRLLALPTDSSLSGPDVDPVSRRDHLRALQALQQQGASLAYHLFRAAWLQDPNNTWAGAYAGYTAMLLGDWTEAEAMLASINEKHDKALWAQAQLWLGELSYRRGEWDLAEHRIEQASRLGEELNQPELAGRAYRLQAQISFQRMDWENARLWQQRANDTPAFGNALEVQAERLFYLGSPVHWGLEKDRYNDLMLNGQRLKKALAYYQQLDHKPQIAAANFALGQNYLLPLDEREQAMSASEQSFRELGLPFELTRLLLYRGFYLLQLRRGEEAAQVLDEASELASSMGSRWLEQEAQFYRAFADLDQGIDRGEGPDVEHLRLSVERFEEVLAQQDLSAKLRADALLLQGWAQDELGSYDRALANYQQALEHYRERNLSTSYAYSVYSMMWNHLQSGRPEQVLALASEPVESRLQLDYLAHAYALTGDHQAALSTLHRLKQHFPDSWRKEDETRLVRFSELPEQGLGAIPSAHLVYCETDWVLGDWLE